MKGPIPFILENSNWHKPSTLLLRKNYSPLLKLSEFQNVLLGQCIVVYTDHKKLTYKNFNTAHVMHWHLILEEFAPKNYYIKCPTDVVANALSHLNILNDPIDNLFMVDCYGLDKANVS